MCLHASKISVNVLNNYIQCVYYILASQNNKFNVHSINTSTQSKCTKNCIHNIEKNLYIAKFYSVMWGGVYELILNLSWKRN